MSLTKVNYVAEETVISAQNLNNIQDSVISLIAAAKGAIRTEFPDE